MEEFGGVSLFGSKKPQKRKAEDVTGDKPAKAPVRKEEALPSEKEPKIEHVRGGLGRKDFEDPEDDSGLPSTSGQATTFEALGLSEWLIKVLKNVGIKNPTEVQRHCIPQVLKGRNVIGCAQTGSGKTAAFALPIIQALASDPYGVFALVLTPTRELAMQIGDQFKAFGAGMTLTVETVIGGLDMQAQAQKLNRRPHVVIATPGRLAQLIKTDPGIHRAFKRCRYLVLDEADRILEPSFEDDLAVLLEAVPKEGRQTLLFSATMTQSMEELRTVLLTDAYYFQAYEGLKTADRLKEQFALVPAKVKEVYLLHLLKRLDEWKVRSCIIFTGTCKSCEFLDIVLQELFASNDLTFRAVSLHSKKSQRERLAALDRFKSSQAPVLIATDVASRGLDIPTVDLVINFDLPKLAQDYVHRVGRTARAGKGGWSLSLVTQYDVQLVQKIEALIGKQLGECPLDEKEVLKGITRVLHAKRAAALRIADAEIVGKKKK